MENILSGNPLLKDKYAASAEKTDLKIKRRWDDDVVFKNCSRAESDKKPKEFINDSLRNEFHRKFMDKYIKQFTICQFSFVQENKVSLKQFQ